MWQRKQVGGVSVETSSNDFRTSDEERGYKPPSHSWWLPVTGIALIALLLLYVSLVR